MECPGKSSGVEKLDGPSYETGTIFAIVSYTEYTVLPVTDKK